MPEVLQVKTSWVAPEGHPGETLTLPTYREHQQLVCVLHELAELLDTQSQELARSARQTRAGAELPEDSPLRATWPHLGTAFQLLTQHAQSLKLEVDRLVE